MSKESIIDRSNEVDSLPRAHTRMFHHMQSASHNGAVAAAESLLLTPWALPPRNHLPHPQPAH